tara:strand:- start:3611 stop:4360 length:750 start_codon:yes stop_codon:yes gene_type:complete
MSSILNSSVARPGVLLLALNRLASHHALNRELASALVSAVDKAEADETIKAIVITGAGNKAFCAGQDMVEERDRDRDLGEKVSAYLAIDRFSDSPMPLIAAVNGYCFGGGAALACACDIRLASDSASFRFPGAEYGLVVGAAALPHIVGLAKAKEFILTAKRIEAQEAKRCGLVNEVYPQEELLEQALNMAEQIAANSALAVRESKRIMDSATLNNDARHSENSINSVLRGSDEQSDRFEFATRKVTGR